MFVRVRFKVTCPQRDKNQHRAISHSAPALWHIEM